MENVIDLARYRRMQYELGKTEKELSTIDFDEFGNPFPLEKKIDGDKKEGSRKETKRDDTVL